MLLIVCVCVCVVLFVVTIVTPQGRLLHPGRGPVKAPPSLLLSRPRLELHGFSKEGLYREICNLLAPPLLSQISIPFILKSSTSSDLPSTFHNSPQYTRRSCRARV